MATEVGTAYVTILPNTAMFGPALRAGVEGQGEAAGQTAGAAAGLSAGQTFAAVFAATAAAVGLGVNLGSQFDGAFDSIRINTGKTGEELAGLEQSFKRVFATTPSDMQTVADVVSGLNQRLGLTGPSLEGLATQLVNLSQLTGGDAAASVESIARLFGDWGVATDDQAGALDRLFRASQVTGTPVERLGDLMVRYGAPIRQFGFSFDQAAALMGRFEREGVNTELVAGSLRQALAKFAEAGREPAAALQETITAVKSAGSVAEANQIAMDIFGRKAGPDMAAAIREGKFEIGEMVTAIGGGTDTITGLAEDSADAGEKLKIFANRIKTAFEPVATKLFELFGAIVDGAGPVVDAVGGILSVVVGALAAIPGPVYLVVGAVGVFIGAFLGLVKTVTVVKSAFSALGATMAANPVLLVILLIVAAIYLLWRNWDTVVRWLGIAWEWLGNLVRTVWGWISGVFTAVGGFLYDYVVRPVEWLVGLWLGYWQTIWNIVVTVWNGITWAIGTAWSWIVNTVTTAANTVWSVISTIWNGIAGTIATVGETIKGAAAGAFNWIVDKLTAIRDMAGKVGEKFSEGFGKVVDWATSAKDKVVEFVQAVWDKLKEIGDWISKQTSSDSWAGKLVGKATDAVSWVWRNLTPAGVIADGFARGGRVTPGMGPVWVGERGPELVTFSRAGRVIPSDESMRIASRHDQGVHVSGPLLAITGDVSIRSDADIVDLSRQLARDINTRARAAGDGVPITGATR